MECDFWIKRWHEGQTGFHQKKVTPLLQKFWPGLNLPTDSQVLVPLCGKSLDMVWLAAQGHRVLGIELASLPVEQFFDENNLQPTVRKADHGVHYVAGNLEIICGDIFAVDASTLAQCTGVYDRAALIALPDSMRERYTQHVYGSLADNYQGLLLTLEYDQTQMDGPPFSVGEPEVMSLFSPHSQVTVLDRRGILDKEPKFAQRGLTALDTVSYRLNRKA